MVLQTVKEYFKYTYCGQEFYDVEKIGLGIMLIGCIIFSCIIISATISQEQEVLDNCHINGGFINGNTCYENQNHYLCESIGRNNNYIKETNTCYEKINRYQSVPIPLESIK